MSILDSKTRVTFVTEIEIKQEIEALVMRERRNGRKMTVSKYIDEVLRQHIEQRSFWGVDNRGNHETNK